MRSEAWNELIKSMVNLTFYSEKIIYFLFFRYCNVSLSQTSTPKYIIYERDKSFPFLNFSVFMAVFFFFFSWWKNVDCRSISKYAEFELFLHENSIIDVGRFVNTFLVTDYFVECWLYTRFLVPIFRYFQQFCESQASFKTLYSEISRTQIPWRNLII